MKAQSRRAGAASCAGRSGVTCGAEPAQPSAMPLAGYRAGRLALGSLALVLVAGAALAQPAVPPATPGPTNPEGGTPPGDQRQAPPPTSPQQPGGRNRGVIPPPPGIDPQIHVPAPDPTPNTTPVIPPPGTPGGDPTVQPR